MCRFDSIRHRRTSSYQLVSARISSYQLVSARISCLILFAHTIYAFGHSADTGPIRRYVLGNSQYRIQAPLAMRWCVCVFGHSVYMIMI
ncbi:predicted protein [Ostreococcus lucimarinus CCE9901]|uniref:Uncharacterized protein n=1 Tax=Ostreococcus lucimarinus (strain CCE9901) TaxID=436017 RepID=A4SAI2_OSTLU|nr:predicted protein [Ostreococcus lucimarinus CCE9901]ABP00755.1 predicted protein [Ostreococcus lucimarinus CCE9901]|eukprot:XP_001422438.1 predicted protein [Ostreococcus lucimarinus CCE9901]